MESVVAHLLAQPTEPARLDGVADWWSHHGIAARDFALPIERAMAGAFRANCLGFAFASGYQEALRSLVPGLPRTKVALCATEEGGNHPRAIQTRLEPDGSGWRVTGAKSFVTLGAHADDLLVVAGLGADAAGLHRLAVVRVPASRAGVTLERAPEAPFVPEISHARVTLDRVRVDVSERLPGDGYADYLKPFRTVEDCHVHAAALAYLLRVCRRSGWPDAIATRLVAALVLARTVGLARPSRPATHIALAGLIDETRAVVAALDDHWSEADPAVAAAWRRDRALFGVAAKARARRLEAAWERVRAGAP